jgi:hypothetical protein
MGFDIKLKYKTSGASGFLFMRKNILKPLNLNLKYEDDSSFDLIKFNKEKKIDGVWWGTRSVFNLK